MAGPWDDYQTSAPPKPKTRGSIPVDHPAMAYQSEADFRSTMDQTYGSGKWRETGGYRDAARNAQVGGVPNSNHKKGTPDAPGAHDIVVEGEDPATAASKLPPWFHYVPEGRIGDQGPHVHVDAARAPAEPPWAAYKAPAPAASSGSPAKPVDPAALRRGVLQIGQGGAPVAPAVGPGQKMQPKPAQQAAAPTKPFMGSIGRRSGEGLEQLGSGLGRMASPNDPTQIIPGAAQAASGAWHAATALPAGLAENATGAGLKRVGFPESSGGDFVETALGFVGGGEGAAARARKGTPHDIPEFTPEPVPKGAKPRVAPKAATAPPTAAAEAPGPWQDYAPAKAAKAPRARSLAAEEPPGKPLPSDIVGDERNPATRTANALYRLNGGNTADKIEMQQFRDALPPEVKGQSEDLYHALEAPLAKPGASIPEHLADAHAALKPYLKEQTDLVNDLRKRGDPTLDEYVEDQGYVHRIRADKPNILDPEGGAPRSPFQTRKSLVKKADSQRQRKYIALETEGGERIFPKGQDEPGNPYKDLKPGQIGRGAFDKPLKVVQPTTAEIEANTKTRYQKDAFDNTLANVMQLRRVKRNVEVLDQTLDDMKERGVAHRAEWHYPDGEGGLKLGTNKERAPQGFVSIPDVPQLKGWLFDKNDAQVQELKDWLPRVHDEDWLNKFDKVNNFMLRSNFLSPFVHPKNVAEFWATGRGGDWLTPQGYGRLGKTWSNAVSEVLTMGPKYKDLLREGSALMSGDARTAKFHEMLVNKGGEELAKDPKSFAAIQESFGKPFKNAADMYTKYQEWSHKMMWMASDVMMMQRVLELQDKGMPVRDAIRKAEEMIPNYRVPAQIMDSPTGGRILNHMFSNNRIFSIGRYHYNKLAAWGRMFKKIAKGTAEERKEAAGQFLVAAVLGGAVLPLVDQGLKTVTGNKNAKVKRGGLLAVPDAIGDVASGQKNMAQAIASIIDLSPAATLASEEIKQKDYFGNDITSKFNSPAGNAARSVEVPAGEFGPASMGMNAMRGNYGPGRVAGNLFGVELPDNPPGATKGSTAKMLRGKARKQERNDPLISALSGLQ